VLDALRAWYRETGGAPRSYEWSPGTGRALGQLPGTPVAWERRYPRFPGTMAVYRWFDSWSEALRAAGLPAAEPVTHDLPPVERVETARRLARQGHSLSAIADLLGVARRTAREYLVSGHCPRCGQAKASRRSETCASCSRRAPRARAYDRATVLARLNEWYEETGESPAWSDWRPSKQGGPNRFEREWPRWPPAGAVRAACGSWNAALAAARLPRHRHQWSHERIVAAMQRWASEHGAPPTSAQFDRQPDRALWPSSAQVAARWGSFSAALEAAGFAPRRREWTLAEIPSALRALRSELGRQPTIEDLHAADRARYPAPATVQRRYGSWRRALDDLGWKAPWTTATREDVGRALRAFHAAHGRPPSAREWQHAHRRPVLGTIVRLYGSWAAALRHELTSAAS